MRLKNIEMPADAGIVNDVWAEATQQLGCLLGKCNAPVRAIDSMPRNLRRQRLFAKPLGDNMQIEAPAGRGVHKLPTPLAHAAAPAVEVVDHDGDSHQLGHSLPRPAVDESGVPSTELREQPTERLLGRFPFVASGHFEARYVVGCPIARRQNWPPCSRRAGSR